MEEHMSLRFRCDEDNEFECPTWTSICEAHLRIAPFVHRTPVLTCKSIDDRVGASAVFFKCENLQKIGAFKFRGATNAVLSCNEEDAEKGFATHSSGNHAQALALAAKMRSSPAYIVMPETAPKVKVDAVRGYDGQVTFCEPTLIARETTLQSVVERTGATFIHPYNNIDVIKGQATAAKELIEDMDVDLDILLVPVGGGGLASGTCLSAHYIGQAKKRKIVVIGAEPSGADDAFRSLAQRKIVPSVKPDTVCDGLLTSLGSFTFPILDRFMERILTVEDSFTLEAMKLVYSRMKLVIEPSAACVLGAMLKYPEVFKHKKVGTILSGGNIDLLRISSLLS